MALTSTITRMTAASVLALGIGAGAAFASGPVTVTPPGVYVTPSAPAYSWAGFYGGLSVSAVSGGINENSAIPAQRPDLVGVTGFGAFAGYNWQHGNVVFGGELNYTNFSTTYVGFPAVTQDNAIELRARAGYAFNRVLVYGFVGAARSTLVNGAPVFTQTGISYGLGVETFVSQRVSVGLELARRDVRDTVGGLTLGTNVDTVSLRAAYHF